MGIQDHLYHLKRRTILFHSRMEKSIQMAKSALAEIFQINAIHFEQHTSRTTKVIEARRFLIYYLFSECGIKHLHMKKYVPALKNHATSIHHYKKMKELMDVEPETERSYDNFRAKMEKEGHNLLMKDYTKAIREMALVQERLETLKKMI